MFKNFWRNFIISNSIWPPVLWTLREGKKITNYD